MLYCEIFYVWGVDFIGSLPSFFGFIYILLVIDYVSKWVEGKLLLLTIIKLYLKHYSIKYHSILFFIFK